MPENYILLERTELNAAAASVTFANIPQTGYTDLKIVMSTRVSATSNPDFTEMSVNGSLANFTSRRIQGNGASATSSSFSNSYSIVETDNFTANTFGSVEIYCPNYTSSNPKSFSVDAVTENNATTSYAEMWAWLWNQTASITSLGFARTSGTFLAGSTFSLYGIAALGTTPVIAPKAIGGNRIDNDGTYWYHTFTSSGTFAPLQGINADYLVVAGGGGGGGYYHGAGGGAGGLRAITNQALTATSYNVVVGGGGPGGIVNGGAGTNGVASSFNSFATSGGGGGGSTNGSLVGSTGKAGGSGGGAPSYNSSLFGAGNAGSYSPVEGYAGGTAGSSGAPYYGSGGGGGAAAVGSNGSSSAGGAGGAGTDTYNSINFSTWLTATGTGSSSKLAGGGGGSAYDVGTFGAGGVGGGGRGANQSGATNNPVAGTDNTGGGGGGSERSGAGVGAAGGSGLVIIRYPIA